MAQFIALGGVSLKMDYNESVGLVDDNGLVSQRL
jgi:ABC-type polysaccharide/polyol phosphate transport system ATPase subunit